MAEEHNGTTNPNKLRTEEGVETPAVSARVRRVAPSEQIMPMASESTSGFVRTASSRATRIFRKCFLPRARHFDRLEKISLAFHPSTYRRRSLIAIKTFKPR